MYRLLVLLSLIHFGGQAHAQPAAAGNVLQTIEGKKYIFRDPEELQVIIFLSPDCPLSQKYTRTLNELASEFKGKAKFYGVFAETSPQLSAYKNFKQKYRIQFPLLVDKDKKLVKALGATTTPESFVLNKGAIVYHGAIDDWAIELGKTKNKATTSFVRTAIHCAMANTSPVPDYHKPIGCFID